MPRFNMVDGVRVQCSAEDETYFDALNQTHTDTAVARASAAVRKERDALIAATDWWALGDRSITDAQTAYRLALRNVPAQAGFPDSITWPTAP